MLSGFFVVSALQKALGKALHGPFTCLATIPTRMAVATVPSRTPSSRCKNSSDSVLAMSTSVTSKPTLVLGKGVPKARHTASTMPSPASVTTFAVTSKLTPIPTSGIPTAHTSQRAA